ncbi:cell division control protein 42 homolog [Saccostrea cucullata]|uniref:cell division control protein 42 homolog n=1 Tax=Saccostrea cuccullata TaxID=36930 RepID=UPI002ED62E76
MVHASEKVVRCTVVGDGFVGKSSVIKKFIGGQFSSEYVATIKDEYSSKVYANGDVYDLHVTDIAGEHEDLSSLPTPDVFVVCFSLVDKDSMDSIENFWLPKVRSLGKHIPLVLVATQSDLRKENENGHISTENGQKISKTLGTESYVECSAKMNLGIQEVFEKIVCAKIRHSKKRINIIKRVFGR